MSERKKGKSLLKVPADYTVVDIETTGYDQRYDKMLEDLDDYFDIGIVHHRAVSDCETTNAVLQKLAAIIVERQIDLSPPNRGKVDLRALSPESDSVRIDSPLCKKVCVFTGTLERYTRVDAAKIVVNLGGLCGNNVTKATKFLIVGDFDYSSGVKGGKSNKLKRAEQFISKGSDLQILSEHVFYNMLSDIEETLNG